MLRRCRHVFGLPSMYLALAACHQVPATTGETPAPPAVVQVVEPLSPPEIRQKSGAEATVEPVQNLVGNADHGGNASVHVIVGGDLIPHRPSLATPASITAALAPLADTFREADVVVANYEAATGALEKKAFRLAYAAPPDWLAALPAAGIGAVSVANNHACDLDYDGVDATLAAAAESKLTALGGDAKGDPWQPRVIAEKDGKKVCAVAWTTLINAEGGCKKTVRLAVAPEGAAGRVKVATALQRARAQCDATIAIIHGGVEYAPQTGSMMMLARQAADAGADAIVVHHPHIASPVLVHATKDGRHVPIFASVGNLVSNQGESWKPPMFPVLRTNRRLVCVNGWTRLGVLADLKFDWAEGGAPKLDWGFHLIWNDNEHADDHTNKSPKITARLVDPKADAEILEELSHDEDGPVALFSDPCWLDHGKADDARCTSSIVHETRRMTARRR